MLVVFELLIVNFDLLGFFALSSLYRRHAQNFWNKPCLCKKAQTWQGFIALVRAQNFPKK